MFFTLTTVITTINGRFDFLKRAVNSVAKQDLLPNMIIIISQGLNDKEKLEIDLFCRNLSLEFEHINFPKLIGSQLARYYGLLKTSTKYIHFLDDDDYIFPKMYSNAKQIMISNNKINLLSFNAKYQRKNLFRNNLKTEIITNRINGLIKKSELLISNKVGPTSGAIICTDILYKIDSFNPGVRLRQDYSNWLLISNEDVLVYASSELGFYYETQVLSSIFQSNPFKNGYSIAKVWNIRFKIAKKLFYKLPYAFLYDIKFIIAKIFERVGKFSIEMCIIILYNIIFSITTYILTSLYLFIKYLYHILKISLINIIFNKK